MDPLLRQLDAFLDAPDDSRGAIERDIWHGFGTTGTAFVLDLAGFAQGTRVRGIIRQLASVRAFQRQLIPVIEAAGGRVIKCEADNIFACFADPDAAAAGALAASAAAADSASIGLCHGDLLVLDNDYFGDCVNIASKLGEDIAGAGEILIDRQSAALLPPARRAHTVERPTDHALIGAALRILPPG